VNREELLAHLNLYAVLQNLEELVRFDETAAALVKPWDVSIQFRVRGGPAACLAFAGGTCKHGRGRCAHPSLSLWFVSAAHLNRMFAGKGIPVPLRGWTRLGWLGKEFSKLTDRLGRCLRPEGTNPTDESLGRLRPGLMLQTAVFAAAELARLEPTCREIAARMPDSVLAVEVLPDGPRMQVSVAGGQLRVEKRAAERPTAKMTFRDIGAVADVLEKRVDFFRAVAEGRLIVRGMLLSLDDFGLILDRVERYLS
jgi:hypothetical protein